jgi:RNA polymerase sigma-70 factor (ECF subfamily)
MDDPFEAERAALFGVAYRMLGTRTDAEDVLQEAWLRWSRVDRRLIENPRAYVFRLVANEAIDQLRRVRTRREEYIGPWLPEPLVGDHGDGDALGLRESASVGLLVVLETLTPDERTVFVLHEAFAFAHAEIAAIIGRSERAVRQLAYRARKHVQARTPRRSVAAVDHRELTARFVAAAVDGDIEALLRLLAPDAVLRVDSGGSRETPLVPLHGAVAIAHWFRSAAPFWPADVQVRIPAVNGGPGALIIGGGAPFVVLALEVADNGELITVDAVLSPEKLRRVESCGVQEIGITGRHG